MCRIVNMHERGLLYSEIKINENNYEVFLMNRNKLFVNLIRQKMIPRSVKLAAEEKKEEGEEAKAVPQPVPPPGKAI